MHCHLTLTKRVETGKGASRRLRKKGEIPAVLYGQGKATSLTIDSAEFNMVLRSKQRGYVLISLTEANAKGVSKIHAVLQDVQYDPISEHVLHVDLLEVLMDQPIQVSVPILITGSTPIGVTLGGVLRQRCRYLIVEGLPADIPDTVALDASRVGVRQILKVEDITCEKGIKICDDQEKVVISITAKKEAIEAIERQDE